MTARAYRSDEEAIVIDLVPDDTQEEIAGVARRLAERVGGRSSTQLGADEWTALRSAGVFGLGLPASVGGSGYGLAEEALVAVELGAALAPLGVLGGMLGAHISGSARHDAAGLGLADPWVWGATGEGNRLRVLEPELGSVCVITTEGVAVLEAAQLTELRPCDGFDQRSSVAVAAPPDRSILVSDSVGLLARAVVLVAGLQVGIARRTQEIAVAHAGMREQFGKPIGSFQAVKHLCAGQALATDVAQAALAYAAAAYDAGIGTLDDARVAAIQAGDAALGNSRTAIQVLGGLGVTAESGLHHFLRRAVLLEQLLGSSAYHGDMLLAQPVG